MRFLLFLSFIVSFLFAANPIETSNTFFYSSVFGFQANNISKNWTLLTNKSSSSLIEDMLDENMFSHLDKNIVSIIKKQVQNKELEILIFEPFSNEPFKNNIVVTSLNSKKILHKEQRDICPTLESDFRDTMKNKILKMKYCEIRNLENIEVFTYLIDNYLEQKKIITYIFNTNKSAIRFTLACNASKCNSLKKETEEIIKKIQFNIIDTKTKDNEAIVNKQKNLLELNPSLFCKPDGFFINCYKISENECSRYIFSTTAKCMNESTIDFTNIENYKHMGEIIGRCVGEEFSSHFDNRYIKNEKCMEPSNFF